MASFFFRKKTNWLEFEIRVSEISFSCLASDYFGCLASDRYVTHASSIMLQRSVNRRTTCVLTPLILWRSQAKKRYPSTNEKISGCGELHGVSFIIEKAPCSFVWLSTLSPAFRRGQVRLPDASVAETYLPCPLNERGVMPGTRLTFDNEILCGWALGSSRAWTRLSWFLITWTWLSPALKPGTIPT